MKIESQDLSIEALFTGNYFLIPRFQREYSWEEENINEFWNDVSNSEANDYFIGSMVVYESKKGTLGIVDGQQRITTIMVLLCAIRDAFAAIGEKDKASGLHTFVERKDRENQKKYVLQTESSFPFLQDSILKVGEPDLESEVGEEEKALQRAANIFSKCIASELKEIELKKFGNAEDALQGKIAFLTNLRDSVLELNVILIRLDNEDDAYLIFETLNTRGKDLALSDLVKNLFARTLRPDGDLDAAKLKWNQVLDIIRGSDANLSPDTFIVHSWQSRFDAVTKAKAYPKLKSAITSQNAKKHLDSFIKEAGHYRSIYEPEFTWKKDEKDIQKCLRAFRLFKLEQPTPALLSLVRAYRESKIKRGKLLSTLRAIENFHFQFTAVTSSRSSGGISGMYSSFGRKLYDASDKNVAAAEIKGLIEKFKKRQPSFAEFSASFEQVVYTKTNTSQRNLVRYILMEINAKKGLPSVGHTDDLTIEHLVPQKDIGAKWSNEIVGQLGNLILVDNQMQDKLGTKPFVDKIKILQDNGYVPSDLFVGVSKITPELIEQNTKAFAEYSQHQVWRL